MQRHSQGNLYIFRAIGEGAHIEKCIPVTYKQKLEELISREKEEARKSNLHIFWRYIA